VVFDTDNPSVVYSVFEVLNSRGLDVDWLDKCKSSLMGIAYEKAKGENAKESFINELNDLWGKIYQEIAKHPVPGHEILRVTATLYNGDQSGKLQKADAALASLLSSCKSAEDTIQKTKYVYEVTKKLVDLQLDVHLGPVTYVLQARVLAVAILLTQLLTETERKKVLSQWEKVTFRIYGIFGKDSRSKLGDYVRLSAEVMDQNNKILRYSEIISEVRKIGSDYKINDAIDEGLRNKNAYDGNQDVIRYILWRYEEHLAKKAGNAIINEEHRKEIWEARKANETVEHILPQCPEDGGAWEGKFDPDKKMIIINSIGNLLLLPQKLNSDVGRKGFQAKKEIYKKSEGLRIVQEVLNCDDWSQHEIKEREEKILNWITEEWQDVPD